MDFAQVLSKSNNHIEIMVFGVKVESLNSFISQKSNRAWVAYRKRWAKVLKALPTITKVPSISRTIITSYRHRFLDYENIVGGSKPIRDAFESLGWIYNDSMKWSEYQMIQRPWKDKIESTHIRVDIIGDASLS